MRFVCQNTLNEHCFSSYSRLGHSVQDHDDLSWIQAVGLSLQVCDWANGRAKGTGPDHSLAWVFWFVVSGPQERKGPC
jgi:hypothetical protein